MLRNYPLVSVSFFGASHIAMPLQEAKISTNIRLRFRTHQENALLLLAAGRTDYCLVALDAGRIKFLFKVDDFVAEVWRSQDYPNHRASKFIFVFVVVDSKEISI